MTDLWLLLVVKSTAVLSAGTVIAHLLRRSSAAARHLIWLTTAAILLLLPFGLLLPDSAAQTRFSVSASAVMPSVPTTAEPAFPALVAIWAVGFALMLTRLMVSLWRGVRLVRTAHSTADHRLRFTSEVPSPLAWSFGAGTIVLPSAAASWREDTLTAALEHEAAHLTRRDCQALLTAELALAVYWFHPLMWYALRRLRTEQEHAADDAVLAAGVDPAEYAQHLVELARFGRTESLLAGAGTPDMLTTRVATILDQQRRRTVQSRRMVLTGAAAVLAIALPLAALQADDTIYSIGDEGISLPELLIKQEPSYTEDARDAKIEGKVALSAVIGTDGRLTDIDVRKGLDPGLDQNAMTAIAQWVFKPAEKNGTPVRVRCNIEVNFRLL